MKRGFEIEVRRLDCEDALPNADHVDGLVVMGVHLEPMKKTGIRSFVENANCSKKLFAAETCTRHLPGSATVGEGDRRQSLYRDGAEIEFGSVDLPPAGQGGPLFAGTDYTPPAFHWHGDIFRLPEGAESLASTPMYQHQAFRFGNRAYGLQFHLESDAELWAAWRDHLPTELIDRFETKLPQIEETGKKVIARFFEHGINTAGIEAR